jgi:hypothetical protein
MASAYIKWNLLCNKHDPHVAWQSCYSAQSSGTVNCTTAFATRAARCLLRLVRTAQPFTLLTRQTQLPRLPAMHKL